MRFAWATVWFGVRFGHTSEFSTRRQSIRIISLSFFLFRFVYRNRQHTSTQLYRTIVRCVLNKEPWWHFAFYYFILTIFFCHSVSFDIPTSRSTRVTRPLIVKSKLLFTLSERFWKRQNETVSRMLHFAASHTQTHRRAHTSRIYTYNGNDEKERSSAVSYASSRVCAVRACESIWLDYLELLLLSPLLPDACQSDFVAFLIHVTQSFLFLQWIRVSSSLCVVCGSSSLHNKRTRTIS